MAANINKQRSVSTALLTLLALFTFIAPRFAYADFSDNGDGTITDTSSTLMWQRCSAPSDETVCGSITPLTYNWDNALAYCNALTLATFSNWRLPNVKELHSLLDVTKTTVPNINTSYFSDTQTGDYWTSTTLNGTPVMAWYVKFNISSSGFVMTSPLSKTNGIYVRCVR